MIIYTLVENDPSKGSCPLGTCTRERAFYYPGREPFGLFAARERESKGKKLFFFGLFPPRSVVIRKGPTRGRGLSTSSTPDHLHLGANTRTIVRSFVRFFLSREGATLPQKISRVKGYNPHTHTHKPGRRRTRDGEKTRLGDSPRDSRGTHPTVPSSLKA